MTEQGVVRRLVDRVAVITGGGCGIGLATARRFAAEGANVVVGDIDATAGAAAAEEVGGMFVHADVTAEAEVEALFATAVDTYGAVDVAFNNAGISPPDDDSILTTGLDAWRRVQEVNLTRVYLCCKAAHPVHAGAGARLDHQHRVVRRRAWARRRRRSPTPRPRAACWRCRRELGVQFAREGIRVNALCPGPVNTPLLQELFAKDPERAARRLVHIPMGRFAEADEIAAAVAFLASRRLLVHHRVRRSWSTAGSPAPTSRPSSRALHGRGGPVGPDHQAGPAGPGAQPGRGVRALREGRGRVDVGPGQRRARRR